MQLTDKQLDFKAKVISQSIHKKSLELIEFLIEIDRRKSYAVHSYSSLFYYIVKFLGFSEAQAAVYNNIVKSKVKLTSPVKQMISNGELSLGTLGHACSHIKKNPENFTTPQKKESFLKQFKGKSRNETKLELNIASPTQKQQVTIKLKSKTVATLTKIKKKLGTPLMTDDEVIAYLANKELTGKKTINTNKVITPRTKNILLRQAEHRCQYTSPDGVRCQATSNLEVEHIHPRAKGGKHNPENLKILCRAHNQRRAFEEFPKYF